MSEKIYLHLLILCCILFQGIIATSHEDTRESSDFLVRKRRVISHLSGGCTPTPIEFANFVVNIKHRNRAHCAGAILSHYTVITAATCFHYGDLDQYTVLSGSEYDYSSNVHRITRKAENYGNQPHKLIDGIALITVDPPFEFNSRITGHIDLYASPLMAGTPVTVRGWGNSYPLKPGPAGLQRRLRSITVPIMNRRECQNDYRSFYPITDKHICTYDEEQYCARLDVGAPLIFANRLAGIHVWKGEKTTGRNPDVYVDLHRDQYSIWIRENTL